MIICVDVQHIGKRSHPADRGAVAFGTNEVWFTERYGARIAELLRKAGYQVHLSTEHLDVNGRFTGDYGERHAYANEIGCELYLACHVNAGGGSYSLIELMHGAHASTERMARMICENFQRGLRTSKAIVRRLLPGDRGAACVSGVNCPAMILEPFFIDDYGTHMKCFEGDGIELIASSVANVIAIYTTIGRLTARAKI